MTTHLQAGTTQVHRIFIRAAPETIFDALTTPEWTERYGYRMRGEFELRAGGAYRAFASDPMRRLGAPEVVVEGEVVEVDPPHRLVHTWHFRWDEALAAEAWTRVTWEVEEGEGGVSTLTVTHEGLDRAPRTAATVGGRDPKAGGGWTWMISDLKSLLETGRSLGD